MRLSSLLRPMPVIIAGIVAIAPATACSRTNEYPDPVYSDRHRWDSREDAAYRRWEAERRTSHMEYERRAVEEQRAYWNWRHAHPD
jgi:hypothetical protein